MAVTAELLQSDLVQFCPVTNHYRCSDGELTWWLLITVPSFDSASLLSSFGVKVPVVRAQMPTHVDVFLADESAVVLDADMDPSNGMTALAKIEDCSSHEDALARMGYEMMEGGPS